MTRYYKDDLVVHVNDGSAHDRATSWSEGHTAGFEEGKAAPLDVRRLALALRAANERPPSRTSKRGYFLEMAWAVVAEYDRLGRE